MIDLNGTEVFCCAKCKGSGKIDQFSQVSNGKCFQCDGRGVLSINRLKGFVSGLLRDELTQRRFDWIIRAEESDWQRVCYDKMVAVENWIQHGPLSGWLVMPELAQQRYDSLLESIEKPF